MLKLEDGRKELYQWDTGIMATVTDEQIDEVHFSNLYYGLSFSVEVKDGKVLIPPEVLQSGADVYCWAYVSTDEKNYTKKSFVFHVVKRPKPAGYAYTPTDIKTWDELNEKIENIVIETDNIKNGAVTIDKLEQGFFVKGIECVGNDDIHLTITQRIPRKTATLTAALKNKVTEVAETSTDNEIPTAKAVYDYSLAKGDVIQVLNDRADNEPQKVYSANVINMVVSMVRGNLGDMLLVLQSLKKNTVTEIDGDNTDAQYPTAKAVYDFGVRIIEAHQEQVDAQINELEERLMSGVEALIGGIENGSY